MLLWGNELSLTRLAWSAVLVGVLLSVIQCLIGAARPSHDAPEPSSPAPEPEVAGAARSS